jgi:hypothetical protein
VTGLREKVKGVVAVVADPQADHVAVLLGPVLTRFPRSTLELGVRRRGRTGDYQETDESK